MNGNFLTRDYTLKELLENQDTDYQRTSIGAVTRANRKWHISFLHLSCRNSLKITTRWWLTSADCCSDTHSPRFQWPKYTSATKINQASSGFTDSIVDVSFPIIQRKIRGKTVCRFNRQLQNKASTPPSSHLPSLSLVFLWRNVWRSICDDERVNLKCSFYQSI